jgi:TetR/AcrR family transcriptional regulator, transcriptional repressor for nem operon
MGGKAELTTQFILERVAPVFNRYGYAATSLSELEKATKLTKGAIYGNFESKEDLAVQAFNYNIRKVIWAVADKMNAEASPVKKLFAMTAFYRDYHESTKKYGGCPLLNVGVDSKHQNPVLLKRVREIVKKLQHNIATIIQDGIKQKQFKKNIDVDGLALRMIAMVEGGVYMSTLFDDGAHLAGMMDQLDVMIKTELMV